MLMRYPQIELQFAHSVPYGAQIHDHGVQFVVYSRSATGMRILLYDDVADHEPSEIVECDPVDDRWGDVWSIFVPGIGPGQLYHFQADGPDMPDQGLLFNGRARLIDPYAKALAGDFLPPLDGVISPPKCVVVDDYFDWDGDRHLRHDPAEMIIYEMHVGGFTRSKSSGVDFPGTYLGVIDKIPYLQSLGVTAVELMPVHEFPIQHHDGTKPSHANYWGYDPMAFFAPHRGYAASTKPGRHVFEFKKMVKALHQAGIEVILDVVFNHTCEGNSAGPILGMKGLQNDTYYMLENGGQDYRNYSGCGNTLNTNHPVVREMILQCLKHWVYNYHIDGFRFDLASILCRGQDGEILEDAPIVEAIAEDPMLADTKIIAEAWDAAGAYQVGSFGGGLRWAEWNGRYRDDVRRFWRGDCGTLGSFATRLAGSSDLYQDSGRPPCTSINFVTSHDGFTMNDLVSYKEKHNVANGEENRDGDNNNLSDNYGVEGPARKKSIVKLRLRQIKNMMTTLMMSQGVPMIVSGDECLRTQKGNNNAYCQDNPLSWFDWKLTAKNHELLRFCQALIHFRRQQPTLRRKTFLTGQPFSHEGLPDVSWFRPDGSATDWSNGDLAMMSLLTAPSVEEDPGGLARDLLFLVNATADEREFRVPGLAKDRRWRMFLDTSAEMPNDIFPNCDGPLLDNDANLQLTCRTFQVYVRNC